MPDQIKTYYFSRTALVIGALLLLAFNSLTFTLSLLAFPDHLGYSLMFAAILLGSIAATYSRYTRFLGSVINKQPAVVLTPQALIEQVNKGEYRWVDILEIVNGYGKTSGAHAAIILKNDKVISISYNAIRCNKKEFLHQLKTYHETYMAGMQL